MSTRNHDRGPDGAGLSLSMTKDLHEAIKKAAQKDGRTVSNFIANTIAVALGMPPEAVIAPNKRRPRTPKPARTPSVEARLDALGGIAKAIPLRDRLNAMPDKKKSA